MLYINIYICYLYICCRQNVQHANKCCNISKELRLSLWQVIKQPYILLIVVK